MIVKLSSENPEFYDVIYEAKDNYYPIGLSSNIVKAVANGVNWSKSALESCMNLSHNYFFSTMNEMAATRVTDPKIVKESKGEGLSIKIDGKEYRYVSPSIPTKTLYNKIKSMLDYSNGDGWKALNWLKKNALVYYGAKNNSDEGKRLVESIDWSKDKGNLSREALIEIAEEALQSNGNLIMQQGRYITNSIESYDRMKSILDKYRVEYEINQATNPGDVGFLVSTGVTNDEEELKKRSNMTESVDKGYITLSSESDAYDDPRFDSRTIRVTQDGVTCKYKESYLAALRANKEDEWWKEFSK